MTTYRPGDHLRTPVDIAADEAAEDDNQCEGHESLAGEHMGESVHCDGTCRRAAKRTRNNGRA
jgi:hypothetical protein